MGKGLLPLLEFFDQGHDLFILALLELPGSIAATGRACLLPVGIVLRLQYQRMLAFLSDHFCPRLWSMFTLVRRSMSLVELLHQVGQGLLALDLINDLEELTLYSGHFAGGFSCCSGLLLSFCCHTGNEAQNLSGLEVLVLHLLEGIIALNLLEELQHLALLARLADGRQIGSIASLALLLGPMRSLTEPLDGFAGLVCRQFNIDSLLCLIDVWIQRAATLRVELDLIEAVVTLEAWTNVRSGGHSWLGPNSRLLWDFCFTLRQRNLL